MSRKNDDVYIITIPKFFEHNKNLKKSMSHFMLSMSFFNDDKIARTSPSECNLYLFVVLQCASMVQSTVHLSANIVPSQCKGGTSAYNQLLRLQSLQLLTFTIANTNSLNRIEKNIIERNRKEVQLGVSPKEKPNKELNAKIWYAYKNAYWERYHVEPVRNASVNSKISQLAKRLGADAIEVVVFFINHNDPFYLKSLHQIGLCLANAEALHTQYKLGRTLMPKDIKNFEYRSNMDEIDRAIENGTI